MGLQGQLECQELQDPLDNQDLLDLAEVLVQPDFQDLLEDLEAQEHLVLKEV